MQCHYPESSTRSPNAFGIPTERDHRCEHTSPTARGELTRAHPAYPTFIPRAAEPAARLRRALIELIDGGIVNFEIKSSRRPRPPEKPPPCARLVPLA